MNDPSVSVLMVQWGKADLTLRALDAARRSDYAGQLELLVWDNGSAGGPGAVSREPGVTVVTHGENLGFGPANNRLSEHATGELLLLLNNDTVLAPSCVRRMVKALTGNPEVAAVTPQFRSFDGGILEMGSFLGSSGEAWQFMRSGFPPRSLMERPLEAHYGSAACLLLRRSDWNALGGFDDLFAPAYYEDTDLCLRLSSTGRRILVEPRAVAFHLEGGTAGTDVLQSAKSHQLRHRGRFVGRWAERLAKLPAIGPASALRHAVAGDRPLVLWLLPEMLKPDQSGGDARVRKELELLIGAGVQPVIWSEHVGDHGRYGALLSELGCIWCGYQEPVRSPLQERVSSCWSALPELLRLDVWGAVVAWSADVASRLGPTVRDALPNTPFLVDSAVLLYLQGDRGREKGASMPESLAVDKDWELGVYGSADAVIASSTADADAIGREKPNLEVVTFDVGAYKPVAAENGSAPRSLLFLGNFIHPPNVDAVMWWLEEIAPRVADQCGQAVPLRVIGASAELLTSAVGQHESLEVVGWVEDLRLEMARARAFFVPLRYGAGTKDKISMAMRYGVPTIATSIGAESMPERLAKVLVVADRPGDLAREVVRLMDDETHWRQAADATRKAAQLAWIEQGLTTRRYTEWFKRLLKID
ncbi:MAG: glycosyltransferase [Acidobacteriota bacterium]